jgi:hypothetical protein
VKGVVIGDLALFDVAHAGPFRSAKEALAFADPNQLERVSETPATESTRRSSGWYVYVFRQTGEFELRAHAFLSSVRECLDADEYGPFSSQEAAVHWAAMSTQIERPLAAKDGAKPRPRLDLLPTAPLEEVARVLAHGAEKYGDYNWCNGTRWGRCYRALLSHAWAWWRGEDTDSESGLSHLAHCICNLLFLMEFQRNGWGEDDRFRGPTGAPFKKNDGAA